MEASLVYRVSSRTAKDTQRNPVSKNSKKKKKKKTHSRLLYYFKTYQITQLLGEGADTKIWFPNWFLVWSLKKAEANCWVK